MELDNRLVCIRGEHLEDIKNDLSSMGVDVWYEEAIIYLYQTSAPEALEVLQKYRKSKLICKETVYRDSIRNMNLLKRESNLSNQKIGDLIGRLERQVSRLLNGDTKATPEDFEDFGKLFKVCPGKITYLTYTEFTEYLKEIEWEPTSYMNANK